MPKFSRIEPTSKRIPFSGFDWSPREDRAVKLVACLVVWLLSTTDATISTLSLISFAAQKG